MKKKSLPQTFTPEAAEEVFHLRVVQTQGKARKLGRVLL
jgi:hypothetical protein